MLFALLAAASMAGTAADAARPLQDRVLDVPYVPQSEAMCGGAAVAMVFRYWGDAHAGVAEFESLLDRQAGGISTARLVAAVDEHPWRAVASAGSLDALHQHISAGEPVILLIEDRPRRYHYIVAIGLDDQRVIVHDPAWGPSRSIPVADLIRRWAAADFWSLLIRPVESRAGSTDPASTVSASTDLAATDGASAEPVHAAMDRCGQLLASAINDGRALGLLEVEARLEDVRAQCPQSAGPLRELAGVRFAQSRWRDAAALARAALALDARDEYAWDVLGSSLFMVDDLSSALTAWNHIGKPRVDSLAIEGLDHTRYAMVADALALPSGSLLTPERFRLAERRLKDLPDQTSARLGYRLQPDGFAQVDAAVAERQTRPHGAVEWSAAAAAMAIDREATVSLPGGTGQGELWTASWRWWPDRPRIAFEFAAPRVGRGAWLPGILRVQGSWEAQRYGTYGAGNQRGSVSSAPSASPALNIKEDHAHGGIGLSSWLTADLRWNLTAGLDSWNGSRRAASVGVAAERRILTDRIAISGDATTWMPLGDGTAFHEVGLHANFRSSTSTTGTVVTSGGGIQAVTAAAPFSLWPGAGDGHARPVLLRAHPLLYDGVIDGPVFGQRLTYVNVETLRWLAPKGPLGLAVAAFVDLARAAYRPRWVVGEPFQFDAGVGLRMKVPGRPGMVRLDFARGMLDGAHAITVGWQF